MPQVHIATPDGRHEVREESEVRDEFSAGKIPDESLYWIEGMSEWRPIQEFLERALYTNPPPIPAISPPTPISRMAIVAFVLAAVALVATARAYVFSGQSSIRLVSQTGVGAAILSLIIASVASRQIDASNGTLIGRRLVVASRILIGLLFAWTVFAPSVPHRRGHGARWTVDANNLRMIGQASLIYANDNREVLPPTVISENGHERTTSLHDVARLLAQNGGINDASLWFSSQAKVFPRESLSFPVLNPDRETLNPEFAVQQVFAFDYVTGLRTDMPFTTPIAWTRGLRPDGKWDAAGVYGTEGGHIVFLGGNVQFYKDLGSDKDPRLLGIDGKPTSNILDTLPPGTRIVGSGPGSLDGYFKPAETQPAQLRSATRKPASSDSASPP